MTINTQEEQLMNEQRKQITQALHTLESKTLSQVLIKGQKAYGITILTVLGIAMLYGLALYYFVYVVMDNPDNVQKTVESGKGLHYWLIYHFDMVVYFLRNIANLLFLAALILLLYPFFLFCQYQYQKSKCRANLAKIDLQKSYNLQVKLASRATQYKV